MAMQNRDRLLKKLAAIQGKPRTAMHTALDKGSDEVVDLAKVLVPKKSGKLEKSIGKTFADFTPDNANVRGVAAGSGGDPDLTVVIHAGDEDAFYAGWVEHGTAPHPAGGKFEGSENPGAAAQPFFFPAYRALKKRVISRITRAASQAIRSAASG